MCEEHGPHSRWAASAARLSVFDPRWVQACGHELYAFYTTFCNYLEQAAISTERVRGAGPRTSVPSLRGHEVAEAVDNEAAATLPFDPLRAL